MSQHPTGAEGLFSRMNDAFPQEEEFVPETEEEKADTVPDDGEMYFFPDEPMPL